MNYKKGDKVTFRKDLIVGRKYSGITFNERMMSVKGKTFTIRNGITSEGNYQLYINPYRDFYYSPEMFSIASPKLFPLL